jgi:hypothetical protein
MEKEIMDLAKTNSCAGIFCNPGITLFSGPVPNNFTKKLTTKNESPESTI